MLIFKISKNFKHLISQDPIQDRSIRAAKLDQNKAPLFSKTFSYDQTGNITEEINKAKDNLLKDTTPTIENAEIETPKVATPESDGPIKRNS